jgi:hypothetical protein
LDVQKQNCHSQHWQRFKCPKSYSEIYLLRLENDWPIEPQPVQIRIGSCQRSTVLDESLFLPEHSFFLEHLIAQPSRDRPPRGQLINWLLSVRDRV